MQDTKPLNDNNYCLTTYNNYNQNKSFGLKPYSNGNYTDKGLNRIKNNFFSCMDTYANQKIELEDFDNETDCRVNEMNYYYNNEMENITNQFLINKKKLIDNYTNSIGKYNCLTYSQRKYKIQALEKIFDSGHLALLEEVQKKRNYAIQTYRNKREAQYSKLIDNHDNYWKKGGYLLTD